ncbi:unnamed protein product [Closterium sp. NIES-64]|nr:unnamed protein product [Closterium sp. NIES-64]
MGTLGPLPPWGTALRPAWGPSVPSPPGGRLSGQHGDPRFPPPLGDGSQSSMGTLGPLPPWGTALRPAWGPLVLSPPGGRLSGQHGDPWSPPPLGDGSQASMGTLGPLPPWGTALGATLRLSVLEFIENDVGCAWSRWVTLQSMAQALEWQFRHCCACVPFVPDALVAMSPLAQVAISPQARMWRFRQWHAPLAPVAISSLAPVAISSLARATGASGAFVPAARHWRFRLWRVPLAQVAISSLARQWPFRPAHFSLS